MTLVTLQELRSEAIFELFWERVKKMANENGVNDPQYHVGEKF